MQMAPLFAVAKTLVTMVVKVKLKEMCVYAWSKILSV